MITGSATQRVENATMMGTAGSTLAPCPPYLPWFELTCIGSDQLEWQCHDGASNPKATGFPKGFQSCNMKYVPGLAASMRFPSKWSSVEIFPCRICPRPGVGVSSNDAIPIRIE